MAIVFDCPHCGEELQAPESLIGESGPCPDCGKTFTVPTVSKPTAEQTRAHAGGEARGNGEY